MGVLIIRTSVEKAQMKHLLNKKTGWHRHIFLPNYGISDQFLQTVKKRENYVEYRF